MQEQRLILADGAWPVRESCCLIDIPRLTLPHGACVHLAMNRILLHIAADCSAAAWREDHGSSQLCSAMSGRSRPPDACLRCALSSRAECYRRSDTVDGIRPGWHRRSKHSRLHRRCHLGLELASSIQPGYAERLL